MPKVGKNPNVWRAPGVTLYCGNCLEVLKTLESGSVDAVVTDPPYGIGFIYNGKKESGRCPKSYWHWFQPIYSEMLRCLRPGGLMAIWQAQLNFRHFWDWFGEGIKIYAACKNFVQLRPTPIQYAFDPVVMFYKAGASPIRPAEPSRSLDWSIGNTAGVISNPLNIEKGHPTPKPLGQTVEIVENFSSGSLLDPFMGSGTTGVACVQTGRRFIGVEIDRAYFEIAKKRIKAELDRIEANRRYTKQNGVMLGKAM